MKYQSPFRQKAPLQNVQNSSIKAFTQQASNPYHVAHIQKAFKQIAPKVKFKQPKAPGVGSPWTSMTKGK
jgi:hypothetical protein